MEPYENQFLFSCFLIDKSSGGKRFSLNFEFNSVVQSIPIPPLRRRILLRLTSSLARKKICITKIFASFIGSLISVCPAVQYGLLYTKVQDCDILLRVNNTTALACINKFGSIQFSHFSSIAAQIGQEYEDRNIFLLPRILRKIVDDKVRDTLVIPWWPSQESPPSMKITFPGGRETIRRAFLTHSMPPAAIPALLASFSESTFKQYSYPLRAW
ncbi:hypothetical protein ALC62_15291 [Cyphomyrmex costatus]|uniref:Uncharacterized protein n=1 Tax=Cyphomyrmex costatus TaxID=456900 RepID=A0A151I7P2_9HYME|nr:hypothetical protein ALC62_15291 [Cyphomyrmex costatus]